LGAASIQLDWNGTTVVFSGDLGRYNDATMAALPEGATSIANNGESRPDANARGCRAG
jgi:Cft2 family RNA processing exonuclease